MTHMSLIPVDKVPYAEIDEQIRARYKLISEMVGNLYPSILTGEIETLVERRKLGPADGELERYTKLKEAEAALEWQGLIARTYADLQSQLTRLYNAVTKLQTDCTHPNAVETPKSDTGNWCRGDDSYWYEYECPDCHKRWITP